MRSARAKIPKKARLLAEEILTECKEEAEKKHGKNPMQVFSARLLVALQDEFDTGVLVGKRLSSVRKPSRN